MKRLCIERFLEVAVMLQRYKLGLGELLTLLVNRFTLIRDVVCSFAQLFELTGMILLGDRISNLLPDIFTLLHVMSAEPLLKPSSIWPKHLWYC